MNNTIVKCEVCGANKWAEQECLACLEGFKVCAICCVLRWEHRLCSLCGHTEEYHNGFNEGKCQECKCKNPEILDKIKRTCYFNENAKEWHSPFVWNCTCEK